MNSNALAKQRFYGELAKLLEAGFGIQQAADVLDGTGLPAQQVATLAAMRDGLAAGKSIAESFGSNAADISEMERSVLTAGERGGRLAASMRHLSDYFGMLAGTRRELLRSLIHPIIVLHLALLVGAMPAVFANGGGLAKIVPGFLLSLFITYISAFVMLMIVRSYVRQARSKASADRMLRRLPMIGKARENLAMAGFCKVYHTCLLAGLPMRETIRMAAESSRSGMILDASQRLAHCLSDGLPLGPAMVQESAFPKVFARSYSTGELAGTLDSDLENWSSFYQAEAQASARMVAATIPKILYLIVLLYTGWKIAGFYNAYFDTMLQME